MTEGQTITIDRLDGRTEVLRLERIIHQPEFARRAKADAKVADGLTYPNARAAWSQSKRRPSSYGPDDNEPGPSAA